MEDITFVIVGMASMNKAIRADTGGVSQEEVSKLVAQSIKIKGVVKKQFKDVIFKGVERNGVIDLIDMLGLAGAKVELSLGLISQ